MIRTRLLWFTLGFASTSGAIAQFIFRDLWIDRNSVASQLTEKFNSLDSRVSGLESVISNKSSPSQKIYLSFIKPLTNGLLTQEPRERVPKKNPTFILFNPDDIWHFGGGHSGKFKSNAGYCNFNHNSAP